MKKTKIVIDSTSGYDFMTEPYDAEVLRLHVLFGEETYNDGETITPDEFYEKLRNNPDVLPSTSQPTVGKTVEQFERLKSEGYTDLIVLTLSSKLSGTYATTVSAAEMVEGIDVHIIDTKSIILPVYLMGEMAYRMAERGKDPKEIVEHIESIKDEFHLFLAVGDLTLLRKNGRLSTASALIGNVLKVKPVLELTNDGVLETVEKVRTMKKALLKLADVFFNMSINVSDVAIFHSDSLELAEEFRTMLAEGHEHYNEVPIYGLTPVVGSHTGIGTIAIGFRKRRMK